MHDRQMFGAQFKLGCQRFIKDDSDLKSAKLLKDLRLCRANGIR